MPLNLRDVTVVGSVLPGPFVEHKLEALLLARKLLGRLDGADAAAQVERLQQFQLGLAQLNDAGDSQAVSDLLLAPLAPALGYAQVEASEPVATREGNESGGFLLKTADGAQSLRAWALPFGTELDVPVELGHAYRFRPAAMAQRVLLARAERVGLLTNGQELRIVLADPSGRDSNLSITLERSEGWRSAVARADSFRLVRALCCPAGVTALAELVEQARLVQNDLKKRLREQARRAVEQFIQGLLDAPENRAQRERWTDLEQIARQLWHEGLILVYRILFILKLESVTEPSCCMSFTATEAWRRALSPSLVLAPMVEGSRGTDIEPGSVAARLRELFRLFTLGTSSTGLCVTPLGGALFDKDATALLDSLCWSEEAAVALLHALLWISPERRVGGANQAEERVHYASLDVEDLGSLYETLLELEPGMSSEPLCRLRRARLEVVVPLAQGAPYRRQSVRIVDADEREAADAYRENGQQSKVVLAEEIAAGRFYLRVGLGRKTSGSFYTPHTFVRYLVQETLGPQLGELSPLDDPDPPAILKLKVLDPTMGSGHFLVEACRYLGEAFYEACRLCEELAQIADRDAQAAKTELERSRHCQRAIELRRRVEALPEPSGQLARCLSSAVAERAQPKAVPAKALPLCRRLVAAHCLYGIDRKPMAVELARVALWLESDAEGLTLSFAEHHIVQGDSVTGPHLEQLFTLPWSGKPWGEIQTQHAVEGLRSRFADAIARMNDCVHADSHAFEAPERTRSARENYAGATRPIRLLAAAWSGGVMLGKVDCDAAYLRLVLSVARGDDGLSVVESAPLLQQMIAVGRDGIPYELQFPEVFYPSGSAGHRHGFNAVLGNPPWDAIKFNTKEFLAAFDLRVLEAPTKTERDAVELALTEQGAIGERFRAYQEAFEYLKRSNDRLYQHQKVMIDGDLAGRQLDLFRVLVERGCQLLSMTGYLGFVVPSAFHTAAGAAGVRRLICREHHLKKYIAFLNTRRLFDITPSFEFGLLVVGGSGVHGIDAQARFGLTDPELLASPDQLGLLSFPIDALCQGNPYAPLPTVRSEMALRALVTCRESHRTFEELQRSLAIDLRSTPTSVHRTHESKHFSRIDSGANAAREPAAARYASALGRGAPILHEGATFHRYTDDWGEPPRFAIPAARLSSSERWQVLNRHYKIAMRAIVGSSPEKCIAALLAPGCLVSNSALVEGTPECRASHNALKLLALLNAATFSWLLSFYADLNVNLFALKYLPVPRTELPDFLAHGALRLSCNHSGYAPLWEEQMGDAWRESQSRGSWPVLPTSEARWTLRAQMDAIVAQAYGLDRAQYEHVLMTFSQSGSLPRRDACLLAFDELVRLGLDAFGQQHDPYWDIAPVTTHPRAADSVVITTIPTRPARVAARSVRKV